MTSTFQFYSSLSCLLPEYYSLMYNDIYLMNSPIFPLSIFSGKQNTKKIGFTCTTYNSNSFLLKYVYIYGFYVPWCIKDICTILYRDIEKKYVIICVSIVSVLHYPNSNSHIVYYFF